MKRLLILSNFILLGIIVLMHSCTDSPGRVVQNPDKDSLKAHFNGITLQEFASGVARYKTTHSDLIEKDPYFQGKNFQDARSCWFSISTLKEFISSIEISSAKLKINPDSLGIRFYYGVYPETSKPGIDHFNVADASRHTLFLVPTFSKGPEFQNVDFDPRKSTTPLAEIIKRELGDKIKIGAAQPKALVLSTQASTGVSSPITNMGQLCPAFCNTSSQNTLSSIDQILSNVGYTTGD
jgi:hypothetical protein